MKLVKQVRNGWQYQFEPREAQALRILIRQLPISAASANISKTDTDPKAAEREQLLNESLAEHRAELRRRAGELSAPDKFKHTHAGIVFQISSEAREILLQILNDIRIECWRTLGEPEELDIAESKIPEEKLRHYHLMHLAGFFEWHFLAEL